MHNSDTDAHNLLHSTAIEEMRASDAACRAFAAKKRNLTIAEMIAKNDKSRRRHAIIGETVVVLMLIAVIVFLLSAKAN